MKLVNQSQASLSCDACFNFTVGCQENNFVIKTESCLKAAARLGGVGGGSEGVS